MLHDQFDTGSTILKKAIKIKDFKIYIYSCLLTSERIQTTLVKENRLLLLIESCSASPKLLGYQFS